MKSTQVLAAVFLTLLPVLATAQGNSTTTSPAVSTNITSSGNARPTTLLPTGTNTANTTATSNSTSTKTSGAHNSTITSSPGRNGTNTSGGKNGTTTKAPTGKTNTTIVRTNSDGSLTTETSVVVVGPSETGSAGPGGNGGPGGSGGSSTGSGSKTSDVAGLNSGVGSVRAGSVVGSLLLAAGILVFGHLV